MIPNYAARIRALDDYALERFVKDWAARRMRDCVETQRWSGTGDMGRDVAGYVTHQRHECDWDNFQCKQLSTRLPEREAFVELGKIHALGRQTIPAAARLHFCGPKGVVRNVEMFAAMPDLFTVHAASLDDPTNYRPQAVTYHAQKQAWDYINPSLSTFGRMPPD